jgi:flagellar hook-associated protein 3 FlgL
MVSRVTTSGNYSAVLTNLLAAQERQADAGNRVATQRNGQNLKDYAKSSELLTAMRTVQTRVAGFQDQNSLIADRLTTQDAAVVRVADAAQSIRELMAEAIASGRVDSLVEDIQAQMNIAVDSLNATYGGKYLFAGGQVDTKPVTAVNLADLTLPPGIIANFFKNDDFKVKAKLDDATTVTTGILADDIGTDLLTALQTFEAFNQGPNGPFTGALTDTQKTFLENQLAGWNTIRADVTLIAAKNGTNQKRVDNVATDLEARQISLTSMLSDITDADLAQASADLQQAQLSLQSAAYVFQSLQSSSLINLLR